MPRIRSIKPELPENEALGRVCRDARLLYVLMTTHADDEGRLRANPRYLAHTLFPYDTDAEEGIVSWIRQLEMQRLALTYSYDGQAYVALLSWHTDQRIDKPQASRLPAPPRLQAELFELTPDESGSSDDNSEIAAARRKRSTTSA